MGSPLFDGMIQAQSPFSTRTVCTRMCCSPFGIVPISFSMRFDHFLQAIQIKSDLTAI